MLSAKRNQVFSAPHLVFFPSLAIMLNLLGFNLLGDGLRDALDLRSGRASHPAPSNTAFVECETCQIR